MYYFFRFILFRIKTRQYLNRIYITLGTTFELFIDIDLPINALYCFNLFVELEKNIDWDIDLKPSTSREKK